MTTPDRRLPVWAQIADAVTLSLLALTIVAALGGGFTLSFFGLRLSAHNVTRLLIEMGAVFALRHVLVRRPSLPERIRNGLAAAASRFRRVAPAMLAFGVPGAVYLGVLLHHYDGESYMRGDCPAYYRTARSILEDGDIDISNQFDDPSLWHDVSVAADGRLVPKHPIPMPLASIPFVAAFGPPGALAFNVVQLGCLLVVLYYLAKRWTSPWPAAAAVALTGVATFLPHYVWNYSPDVFASLVLSAALLQLAAGGPDAGAGRFFLGGMLTGLAVMARQPLLVFVPTTFAFARRPFGRRAGALAAGLLISLGIFGLHNARLFGSPFVTAYDRIAFREGSRIGVFSQRQSFTLPMREGAWGQLFDPQNGLLATSAVTLLSLAGLPALAARSRAAAVHIGVGSLALFLMFSMYDQWNASHYGNRFLMPAVALCAIPLAALFELARDRLRRHWRV